MSLHCHEQWLQFGRFGGRQGRRTERREQEESEGRNGGTEILIDPLGMERKWGEVQLFWGGSCG